MFREVSGRNSSVLHTEYGGGQVASVGRDALCGYRADERNNRSTTLIEFRPIVRRPRVHIERVRARIAISRRIHSHLCTDDRRPEERTGRKGGGGAGGSAAACLNPAARSC